MQRGLQLALKRRFLSTNRPGVAFFDCDYTCIANDCELTWKSMLVSKGVADPSTQLLSIKYRDLHDMGALPEQEWIGFLLKEFKGRTWAEMGSLIAQNTSIVENFIFPDVRTFISSYQKTILLSASCRPIVEPVGRLLNVSDVICTNLAQDALTGRFTGELNGALMMGKQKLLAAQSYTARMGLTVADVAYFGDSVSDLPLLEKVGDAHCVNPRGQLREIAQNRRWTIHDWPAPH